MLVVATEDVNLSQFPKFTHALNGGMNEGLRGPPKPNEALVSDDDMSERASAAKCERERARASEAACLPLI